LAFIDSCLSIQPGLLIETGITAVLVVWAKVAPETKRSDRKKSK